MMMKKRSKTKRINLKAKGIVCLRCLTNFFPIRPLLID